MAKKNLRTQIQALEKLAGLRLMTPAEARRANGGKRKHKTSNSVTLALGSGAVLIRKGSGHMLIMGSGSLVMKGTGK